MQAYIKSVAFRAVFARLQQIWCSMAAQVHLRIVYAP